MHKKKRGFAKTKIETEFKSSTVDDTQSVLGVRQVQTAFYFLMLGCVLALACFVTLILCCHFRSKKR
jgi:hypothetical protein